MKRLLMLLLVLGFLFFLCYLASISIYAPESAFGSCNTFGIQKLEKKPAPVFSLIDMDGKRFSLGDFKGKPVLVVFWATW